MKLSLILIILFLSLEVMASSVSIDIGQTKTVFNRFAIPSNKIDRISLSSNKAITSYRLTGRIDLKNNNQFYFLLAPLETKTKFTSTKNFTFNKTNFDTNTKTEVVYKFNSYRLGYLWRWAGNYFTYWTGLVGKVRDAKIAVKQNGKKDSYDNLGFVPLLAFGFDLKLMNSLSLFSHTDALSASQGSAYDSQLELKYNLKSSSISVGKRILGGGADNDEVYTFAQFDTFYMKFSYLF